MLGMTYDEIMDRLNALYTLNDCVFYPEKYRFEIGSKIAEELKSKIVISREYKPNLFGIDIMINYHDPLCIKLWKECEL